MSFPGAPSTLGMPASLGMPGIAEAGRAAESFASDILGLRGIFGKAADPITKIRDFADRQIDALLNGAVAATRGTVEFVEQTLRGALTNTVPLDGAIEHAGMTLAEIKALPEEAMALIEEGQRIRNAARHQHDLIQDRVAGMKRARQSLPVKVLEHFEEISIEFEAGLEAEAAEALRLGQEAEEETRNLYDKTLADAERFSGVLLQQTTDNRQRAVHLRQGIRGGIDSIKLWADEQVQKADRFRSERVARAGSIASPIDAERWAAESVTGAQNLAGEMSAEVSRKPGEAATFGRAKVEEAMRLAQGLKQQVDTAQAWVLTQRGNHARWKGAMRRIKRNAQDFLQGQAARVEMRVEEHAAAIVDTGKKLASAQFRESAPEIGDSPREIEDTFLEAKETVIGRDQPAIKPPTLPDRPDREFNIPLEEPASEPIEGESSGSDPVAKPDLQHREKPAKPAGQAAKPAKGKGAKFPMKAPITKPVERAIQPGPPARELTDIVRLGVIGTTAAQPKAVPANGSASSSLSLQIEQKFSPAKSMAASPSSPATPPPSISAPRNQTKEATPSPVHSKTVAGTSLPHIAPKKELPKLAGAQSNGVSSAVGPSSPQPSQPTIDTSPLAKPAGKGIDLMKAPDAVQGQSKSGESKASGALLKLASTAPSKPAVQRKAAGPGPSPSDPRSFQESLLQVGGQGEQPDPMVRTEIGRHVGFDPSIVRFHTGPVAQQAARSLNADAFTIGQNVFFAPNKFDPRSAKGLGLIGHELTHVGQQLGLKGNKMQFATKTGGDAMEQEAQEVGERIATNLAYANSLRVGNYVRTYEPADDEPITAGLSARLDRISIAALSKAGRILSSRSRNSPLRLDEIVVDVSLDMETLSDAEAIDVWAEAIVAAVEIAHPTSPNMLRAKEMAAPATHILQRSLRDLTAEANPFPQAKVDQEALDRIAKITPTSEEITMIQKLLVRPRLMIKLSHLGLESLSDISEIQKKMVGDDILGLLGEHEIHSLASYTELEEEFVKAFQTKGVAVTHYLLDESWRMVQAQRKKYGGDGQDELGSEMQTLVRSANNVRRDSQAFIDAVGSFGNDYYWIIMQSRGKPNTGNIDSFVDSVYANKVGWLFDEPAIRDAYKRYNLTRLQEGDKHPILLGRDFDPKTITGASSMGKAQSSVFEHLKEVEESIGWAKGLMTDDKFWELPQMISLTKNQMGVRKGEGADLLIKEHEKERAEDKFLWEMIKAGAAVALAVTSVVATGGLSVLAMVGMAGLSGYNLYKNTELAFFKSESAHAALDQAKLISKDDPSMMWLAFDLLGFGMDVFGATWAFQKLLRVANAAMKDAAALKEMESVARDVYGSIPNPRLSEDDFVRRLVDTAGKGARAGDGVAFASQARLLTELLEGTSARAVRILKGDKASIQEIVMEHGNWRGLMGGLDSGGPQSQLIAAQISDWRQGVVHELKSRNASTLPGAGDELASDLDMNIAELLDADGAVIKGAGQNLIDLEKEMIAKYGENWESALHMHFYTEGARLLALDEVLATVSPMRRSLIMHRVTEKAEKLNFAKMLHHAGDDPFAREQVAILMEQAGVKASVGELDQLAALVIDQGRDSILREVDDMMAEMRRLPADAGSRERIALAERISEKQMEANFLMKEAYISPSALKSGDLSFKDAYMSALSQLEMIQHVLAESGGNIVMACRDYELYKYISRYTQAVRAAGISSPGLSYFESLSTFIYKRARSHHMETGPLVAGMDEGFDRAITPQYLFETYGEFMDEVGKTLPQMRSRMVVPEGSKMAAKMGESRHIGKASAPKAAAGGPSAAPELMDYTVAHSGDIRNAPPLAWEGMDIITSTATLAKKAAAGTKKPSDLEPVKSSGFKDSRLDEGYGMYKGRVHGISGQVWLTVRPDSESYIFEKEFNAAIAAAKTGYGPKVHGRVEMGKGKLAFATDMVAGGFADDYNGETHTPGSERAKNNRKEMLGYAKNITSQTFMDVDDYREKIWESGFRYTHTPQGFVTPEGRWRPVDFSGVSPILDNDPEIAALIREGHDKRFDELKERLMEYHIESRIRG